LVLSENYKFKPIDNLNLKQINLFCKIEGVIINKLKFRRYLTTTDFIQGEHWVFDEETEAFLHMVR